MRLVLNSVLYVH